MQRSGGEEQASCDFWLEISVQTKQCEQKYCYGRNLSCVQYLLIVPSSQLPVQDRMSLEEYWFTVSSYGAELLMQTFFMLGEWGGQLSGCWHWRDAL